MIDVFGMANSLIQVVNSNIPATLLQYAGETTTADYKSEHEYSRTPVSVQVQSVSGMALQLAQTLSLQGILRQVSGPFQIKGIATTDGAACDMLEFPESPESCCTVKRWKVVQVLEAWPGWSRVLVQLVENAD